MSELKRVEPVKLIMSVFSALPELMSEALSILSERYGGVDFVSDSMAFDYTDYYEREMGGQLRRRIASFRTLIRPESLPEVKQGTNEIEKSFAPDGKRGVNIDPGYISRAHLILATGKAYSHRPYLRDGVYADLTLIYRDKTFTTLPWTYPDYAEQKMRMMFSKIRERYLEQLRPELLVDSPSGDMNPVAT